MGQKGAVAKRADYHRIHRIPGTVLVMIREAAIIFEQRETNAGDVEPGPGRDSQIAVPPVYIVSQLVLPKDVIDVRSGDVAHSGALADRGGWPAGRLPSAPFDRIMLRDRSVVLGVVTSVSPGRGGSVEFVVRREWARKNLAVLAHLGAGCR